MTDKKGKVANKTHTCTSDPTWSATFLYNGKAYSHNFNESSLEGLLRRIVSYTDDECDDEEDYLNIKYLQRIVVNDTLAWGCPDGRTQLFIVSILDSYGNEHDVTIPTETLNGVFERASHGILIDSYFAFKNNVTAVYDDSGRCLWKQKVNRRAIVAEEFTVSTSGSDYVYKYKAQSLKQLLTALYAAKEFNPVDNRPSIAEVTKITIGDGETVWMRAKAKGAEPMTAENQIPVSQEESEQVDKILGIIRVPGFGLYEETYKALEKAAAKAGVIPIAYIRSLLERKFRK